MELRLRDHSTTFATRERARELIAELGHSQEAIELNVEAVMVSPSFAAELLTGLAGTRPSVTVVGADEYAHTTLARLVEQLQLPNVRLAQLAR